MRFRCEQQTRDARSGRAAVSTAPVPVEPAVHKAISRAESRALAE